MSTKYDDPAFGVSSQPNPWGNNEKDRSKTRGGSSIQGNSNRAARRSAAKLKQSYDASPGGRIKGEMMTTFAGTKAQVKQGFQTRQQKYMHSADKANPQSGRMSDVYKEHTKNLGRDMRTRPHKRKTKQELRSEMLAERLKNRKKKKGAFIYDYKENLAREKKRLANLPPKEAGILEANKPKTSFKKLDSRTSA